jgi:hypothetical protein
VLPPDPVEPLVAALRPTSLHDMERLERCLLAGQRLKAPRKVDLGFDQPMTKIVRQAPPGETRAGDQAVGPLMHRGDADRLGISDGHDRPRHAFRLSTVRQWADSIARGNRRQAHDPAIGDSARTGCSAGLWDALCRGLELPTPQPRVFGQALIWYHFLVGPFVTGPSMKCGVDAITRKSVRGNSGFEHVTWVRQARSPGWVTATRRLSVTLRKAAKRRSVAGMFVDEADQVLAGPVAAQVLAEASEVAAGAELAGAGGVRCHHDVVERP